MIRYVAIGATLSVLALVLYLPAVHPPEHFVRLARAEHEFNAAFWGSARALAVLARALDWQQRAEAAPLVPPASVSGAAPVDLAVAAEMHKVGERLFANRYFRSVDALLLIAAHRASGLIEWLPLLAVLLVACWSDGCVERAVRSHELVQHKPERFGAALLASVLVLGAAAVALVLPIPLHPLVLGAASLALPFLARVALANYHRGPR